MEKGRLKNENYFFTSNFDLGIRNEFFFEPEGEI